MSIENKKGSRLISISSTVMNVLNDMNIYSLDNYERFMQLALRGVKKLYLFSLPTPEVVYLTTNSIGIVQLPEDFITYYKIAIRRNGQLWTLTRNNRLLLPRQIECGLDLEEQKFNDGGNGFYISPHWYNGVYYGSAYAAVGGLNEGYFRYDKEYNRLIISGLPAGSEIVVEYKSNGLGRDGMITMEAEETLIAWIHWKRKAHDETKKYTNYDKEIAKQDYLEERSELEYLQNVFTPDEFLDALYETYQQSPKI